MDEENIRNFEEYIEKFSTHFKISDISIIMWSIVEKTIIKKKTILKIIEQYGLLVNDINQEL